MIGAEVQGSTTEDIEKVIKDQKIKFPVTKGANGPIAVNAIPHTVIFDTKGKLIYSGYPDDAAEKAIKKALKGATPEGEDDTKVASASGPSSLFERKELVTQRDWTDSQGRQLTASLSSLSGNTGTFRRPDGRTFEYDITKLSDEDQKVIAEAAKTKE